MKRVEKLRSHCRTQRRTLAELPLERRGEAWDCDQWRLVDAHVSGRLSRVEKTRVDNHITHKELIGGR